jgi:ribonuclease J
MRHLKQAALLAQQTGIPEKRVLVVENGNIINVKKGKIKVHGTVSNETIFVDGSWVGDLGPDEMRDRTMLSQDGIVLVHINVNEQNGEIYGKPEITSRGFAAPQEADEIHSRLERQIINTVKSSNGKLERDVIRKVRDYIYKETKRRPTVMVTTSQI